MIIVLNMEYDVLVPIDRRMKSRDLLVSTKTNETTCIKYVQ